MKSGFYLVNGRYIYLLNNSNKTIEFFSLTSKTERFKESVFSHHFTKRWLKRQLGNNIEYLGR